MLKIGITGGIGSGKTTVCKLFADLGVPIYNADERAKWLMENDGGIRSSIIAAFGPMAFQAGSINRTLMAETVFANPTHLKRLNAIVHPKVKDNFEAWCAQQSSPYIIKEAALLYESGSSQHLDKVIVVDAPEELRIERVIKRDSHRNRKQVEKIIANQLPADELKAKADYIIINDGEADLLPQVEKLHRAFVDSETSSE